MNHIRIWIITAIYFISLILISIHIMTFDTFISPVPCTTGSYPNAPKLYKWRPVIADANADQKCMFFADNQGMCPVLDSVGMKYGVLSIKQTNESTIEFPDVSKKCVLTYGGPVSIPTPSCT